MTLPTLQTPRVRVNNSFLNDHPHTDELVIEVGITSHEYERSKLRAYACAEVKECWFVLGPEMKIEPGTYAATWFHAFTGEKIPLPPFKGPA